MVFESSSGKVYSDVWKHFVCIKVDDNASESQSGTSSGEENVFVGSGLERDPDGSGTELHGSGMGAGQLFAERDWITSPVQHSTPDICVTDIDVSL